MNDTKRSLPSWLPLAAGLTAAVIGMLLLWFLVIAADDDAAERDAPKASGPRIVESSDLSTAADRLGHPIYWVGERPDTEIELSESDSGRVYVRYLDPGTKAGVRSARFVTVGTYPVENAVGALRRAAKDRPRAELARTDDDAVMLIDPDTPGSVRLAYPGSDEQIEVYSPDIREGLQLVKGGDVQPVP